MRRSVAAGAAACAAIELTQTPVSTAKPIPKPEVEPIVTPVLAMMPLMVGGRYQPVTYRPMNQASRKHLPSHVIGDAHHGHDQEHGEQRGGVDGDNEGQRGDDDGTGQRL